MINVSAENDVLTFSLPRSHDAIIDRVPDFCELLHQTTYISLGGYDTYLLLGSRFPTFYHSLDSGGLEGIGKKLRSEKKNLKKTDLPTP